MNASDADVDLLAAYPYLRRQARTPAPEPEPERPFDYERADDDDAPPPRPEPGPAPARSFDAALDEALRLARPAGGAAGGSRSPNATRETVSDLGAAPAPTPAAHALSWPEARAAAVRAGARPLGGERLPLAAALGAVLAAPLAAASQLPAFDSSAMDGWAVSGPGPWRLRTPVEGEGLAGHPVARPLADGEAVRIATGAELPRGATAVLRREDGLPKDGLPGGAELRVRAGAEAPPPGRDIRPRGQECREGEQLLAAGTQVTPAVLGLAAAVGLDELTVHRRPVVELLVLGDELLTEGPPREGRIRDALGPMLPAWLTAYGARVQGVRRIGDDRAALLDALRDSRAEVLVTTGATAAGPVDFLHTVLAELGARLLVDGVRVRPGHPMLLAELPAAADGSLRHLVGLPGNPLAAAVGAATLAEPLLRGLAGCPQAEPYRVRAAVDLTGHPGSTRLLPVALPERGALPLRFDGPAMLRGLAVAEGFAVVPPGGVSAGEPVAVLDVPCG